MAVYAVTNLNPEPFAYETGIAVRNLIARQIAGQGDLNYDASQGTVVAPWIDWGPDLWADGMEPRSDRAVWTCQDMRDDGTHPAAGARNKVANLLLDFLKTDGLASQWFVENP